MFWSNMFVVLLLLLHSTCAQANILYTPNSSATAGCTLQAGPYAMHSSYASPPHKAPLHLTTFPQCDKSYYTKAYTAAHSSNTLPKPTLRVKWYVLENDDGTNPIVHSQHLKGQQYKIQTIFQPIVSFTFEIHRVRSTFYRSRQAYPFCTRDEIGNSVCNPLCNYTTTGYDGGDCLDPKYMPRCDAAASKGNNRCDLNCNFQKYNYDNGDCCNASLTTTSQTCVDPTSGALRWYTYLDYRSNFFQEGLNQYNIGIVSMPNCPWCGGITELPMSPNALTNYGGSIVPAITVGGDDEASKGNGGMLIHEMGHAFGLGHIYAGVETRDYNSGPPVCHDDDGDQLCIENQHHEQHNNEVGYRVGDLCPDTLPTPVVFGCTGGNVDPAVQIPTADCAGKSWDVEASAASLYNPMSFVALQPSCVLNPLYHFTPCQYGRMRCYIDYIYGTWQTNEDDEHRVHYPHVPSMVVLQPRVVLLPSGGRRTATMDTSFEQVPRVVLLEFGAPLHLGQQGDNGQNVLVRFHISRTPSFEFGQIIQTPWFAVLPGGQYNYTDNEHTLRPGLEYTYQIKTEGPGGLATHFSGPSLPIRIPHQVRPSSPSSSTTPIVPPSPPAPSVPTPSSAFVPTTNSTPGGAGKNALGVGAVVGIVCASVLGAVGVGIGCVFFIRWWRRRHDGGDGGGMSGYTSSRGSYIQI